MKSSTLPLGFSSVSVCIGSYLFLPGLGNRFSRSLSRKGKFCQISIMNMACVKLIRESYGGWRQFPSTVEAFVSDQLGNSKKKVVTRAGGLRQSSFKTIEVGRSRELQSRCINDL